MKPGRTEEIIERLHGLYPRLIDLSLGRLQRLLGQLGHPEQKLPPVLHVAGTNGKGSTCAFLRAIGEANGMRVHVYTSPHLVRFNERIRLAGKLVTDEALSDTLAEVESINAGAPITVFEVLVAAAFVLFARTPADLLVLEVGLGGRGDATNVIDRAAASAITSISLDHREMLGDTLELIAREKAGIMKPDVPVVTGAQTAGVLAVLDAHAREVGTKLLARDRDWTLNGLDLAPICRLRCSARTNTTTPALPSPPSAPPACRSPTPQSCAASPQQFGQPGCNASPATSPPRCRQIGNCGSTAAIIRAPAWCWPSIFPTGAIGRCTWLSA